MSEKAIFRQVNKQGRLGMVSKGKYVSGAPERGYHDSRKKDVELFSANAECLSTSGYPSKIACDKTQYFVTRCKSYLVGEDTATSANFKFPATIVGSPTWKLLGAV